MVEVRHLKYFFQGLLLFAAALLTATSTTALEGYININTASQQQIELLPFMGSVRSRALVKYRQKNGKFSEINDLLEVPGIGTATFGAISRFIRLDGVTHLRESALNSVRIDSKGGFSTSSQSQISKIVTHPGELMLLPDEQFYAVMSSYIDDAKQSINLATYVFKITDSPKNLARLLVERLGRAQRRGIKVSVLLELSSYSKSINKENKRTAKLLRKHGISVAYDAKKVISHMKMIVIDERFCFVGSHNLTHSALGLNHEFSLLIDSKQMAQELIRYMDGIRKEGR